MSDRHRLTLIGISPEDALQYIIALPLIAQPSSRLAIPTKIPIVSPELSYCGEPSPSLQPTITTTLTLNVT